MPQDKVSCRLGYFELIEYRRVNPNLFVFQNYQWTERQMREMNGPRGRNQRGLTRLWEYRPDFRPMPPKRESNPFESVNISNPVNIPVVRIANPPPVVIEAPAIEPPEETVSEQDAVIQASIDSDMLVVAPPGTGKTHVLVERIAYLVGSGKSVNPLAEILVLSFSRSAVAELRKRLSAKVAAGGEERMLYAKIRTFDSLATELLKLDLAPSTLASGYEKRIQQFNETLRGRSLPNAEEVLAKIRFLLIDEVQDLNGVRAEMVLDLARRVNEAGGCSLFLGDPAQAIYDFSNDGNQNSMTSVQFLRGLIRGSYCAQPPRKMEFSQYRRFKTPEILNFVCAARSAMGEDGLSPDGALLDQLLRTLGKRRNLDDLATLATLPGRKALLTQTNLEAYWLWDYCKRTGIPVNLWRGVRGHFWPGWIGRLTLGFQSNVMPVDLASKRWGAMIAEHARIPLAEALAFLHDQGVLDHSTGQIDITKLNYLVGNNSPVQRMDDSSEHIVISTIHRSKGLEFENVFLYAPADWILSSDEGVRGVYVAATRARRHLHILDRNSGIVRKGSKNSRYLSTEGFHIYAYPQFPHIGLLVDGADVLNPDSILTQNQPLENQKFLWERCAAVPRNLVIDDGILSCEGKQIGELNSAIQMDIANIQLLVTVPNRLLEGLVVEDLATVAFDSNNPLARQHLGVACLGIVPVASGIISI